MASSIFPDPIYSGDSIPLSLSFQNSDGTAYDLTGITIGCTVKRNIGDADAAALFQQDTPGDTTGKIAFAITPLNAGTYFVDVKCWNTAAANQRTTVIGTTQLTVNQSVTARALP